MNAILLLAPVLTLAPLEAGTHTREIEHDGRTRTCLVHVPAKYDRSRPTSLILCFHGGGSNARQQMSYCGLNEKADREGFVVAYPNGTGTLQRILTWNAGNCCGYAMRRSVDDVGFVRKLLDDLQRVLNIDANRIYATGISNGAMMSYLLASKMSDRISAIAPVAGPMGTVDCSPRHPVSVMHFHGTKDEFVRVEGGPGPKSKTGTKFYSVPYSVEAWVKANRCEKSANTVRLPDVSRDGMTVSKKTWRGGRGGSEVVLFLIDGGGHTWPGRETRLRYLGPSTKDISANDLMWEFFQRHPRHPGR